MGRSRLVAELQKYPKRLIEVDLPIRKVSEHARGEKNLRHGHISGLHIWWARRPLAACRAVVCACLWPDPADDDCPDGFRNGALQALAEFAGLVQQDRQLGALCGHLSRWSTTATVTDRQADTNRWLDLRLALLDFIADFCSYEASSHQAFLTTARTLTLTAHRWLAPNGSPHPVVHDPFSGGGAMPLEALRVGADAIASDVNPVAHLIEKVALDHVPRFGSHLVAEVRKWGDRAKELLATEVSQYFPADADGSIPIAYLWARTIRCEGPGCGVEVPIVLRTLFSDKRGREVGLLIKYPAGKLTTEVVEGAVAAKACGPGTNRRASVTCPSCGFTTSRPAVERQSNAAGFGMHLLAVCTESRDGTRRYRQPSRRDHDALAKARIAVAAVEGERVAGLPLIPPEELPYLRSIFNVKVYGIDRWRKLFLDRQLLSAVAFVRIIHKLDEETKTAIPDVGLQRAVLVSLALAASNTLQYLTSITTRHPERIGFLSAFIQGQSLPMKMDFAEINPLVEGLAGGFQFTLEQHIAGLESLAAYPFSRGSVILGSALESRLPEGSCDLIATDPPYYDMIPYADCSDFFYVWLRRMLGNSDGNFSSGLVNKADEIVQLAERNEGYRHKTKGWFEARMRDALINARLSTRPGCLAMVVFAHKETAAWEALLQSVLDAGWMITASWPIDTENANRMRASESAVLSSSVHIVCRPRQGELVGQWRAVLAELPGRIHSWMPRLSEEGIVGADAIFACLGPALEIYSRYSSVEKASGEPVALGEYLEQVWAAVSKEALSMMFEGADASGLEEDARVTAMWLWTLGSGQNDANNSSAETVSALDEDASEAVKSVGFSLEYDAARKIAQGLGAHLDRLGDVLEVKGDRARLLGVAERAKHLFGKEAAVADGSGRKKRLAGSSKKQLGLFAEIEAAEKQGLLGAGGVPKVGETTLDKVHQSMILFGAGRSEALKRFIVEEGVGKDDRFWKLAQCLSALYPSGSEEKRWVDGVLARKKSLGF